MKNLINAGLFLLIPLLSCCQRGEREIYILPKGFTGHILIIFNQERGAPRKYEGESRVYEIPETGILKTQFSGNYGWTGVPQFYYGEIKAENQIPVQIEHKDFSSDKINATLITTGSVTRNEDGSRIRFAECYVGTKEQVEEAYQKAEKLNVVDLIK
jgi:hypothetical protein